MCRPSVRYAIAGSGTLGGRGLFEDVDFQCASLLDVQYIHIIYSKDMIFGTQGHISLT